MLHPEIDDPSEVLGFTIDDEKKGIKIVGLDTDVKRGEKTIKICNLNRDFLKIARKKNVTDSIVNAINSMFALNIQGVITDEGLPKALKIAFKEADVQSEDFTLEYTLLRKYMISNKERFDQTIISQLEISQQAIVREAFKAYKNGTL